MTDYKITYYAPYAFAGFECKASTLEEARAKRQVYHDAEGYCVPQREIRSERFAGTEV